MRLRVVKDVNAFPHNDWVVLKQLKTTPARALKLAECWRPWRAYALMHIWRLAGFAAQNIYSATIRSKQAHYNAEKIMTTYYTYTQSPLAV